jgi:hypothetical protein
MTVAQIAPHFSSGDIPADRTARTDLLELVDKEMFNSPEGRSG